MNFLATLIFGIAFIGGIVAAIAFVKVGREDLVQVFESIGGRWGARVVRGGIFKPPRLALSIEGVPGEVTFAFGKAPHGWTKVHFNWAPGHRLSVKPVGSDWTFFGPAPDVKLGDTRFDIRFQVITSDASWASQVLPQRLRDAMLKYHDDALKVDLGPSGVVVRFHEFLGYRRDELVSFIDLAVNILIEARRVPGVVAAEVRILAGNCPVCGHAVSRGTSCPSCRTTHHAECWKYMGGCAIFACGSRRPAA